jgi:hypothetical protein
MPAYDRRRAPFPGEPSRPLDAEKPLSRRSWWLRSAIACRTARASETDKAFLRRMPAAIPSLLVNCLLAVKDSLQRLEMPLRRLLAAIAPIPAELDLGCVDRGSRQVRLASAGSRSRWPSRVSAGPSPRSSGDQRQGTLRGSHAAQTRTANSLFLGMLYRSVRVTLRASSPSAFAGAVPLRETNLAQAWDAARRRQ